MTDVPLSSYSTRVIVIAPTRRDGEVTQRLLDRSGADCTVVTTPQAAADAVREGVGALMVTDLLLAQPEFNRVLQSLDAQPQWSNVPVIALCRNGGDAPAISAALHALRNVTVLDRPASSRTMISAIRAALRGRRWQYQIRDQIAELLQAENALRQADQRKDDFIATLAHELRNPLAPIRTGLQLLVQTGPRTPAFDRVHGMMARQLAQLVKLIDDLLDVSRISTGKIALQREHVDMRDVLRTAIESCVPALEAARHELVIDVPDRPVHVFGDPARLAQAISNLVGNAAKYTRDGGRIRVALSRTADEAVVRVADNGSGIPEGMRDRIFEMFTQVNRTLDRSQGGLGIGLSLVKSLVRLHDGTIAAKSEGVDRGSEFTLTLPLSRAPAAKVATGAHDGGAVASRRVLVVDDNVDAADTLAMLLQLGGHDTRIAYSGATALDEAAAFLPEIIFCDVGMPGMDGLAFARLLRQDERFASTVLVAVTGWGAEEDQRRTRSAGFDLHLTKPIASEAVDAVLAGMPATTER